MRELARKVVGDAEELFAAVEQHHIRTSTLVRNLVALHQKYRLAKNYEVSDALRSVLKQAGVEVVQGTAGYAYAEIPKALQGRQVDDTWRYVGNTD